MTKAEQQIVKMYKEGLALKTIRAKMRCSMHTVYAVLRKFNVTFRGPPAKVPAQPVRRGRISLASVPGWDCGLEERYDMKHMKGR